MKRRYARVRKRPHIVDAPLAVLAAHHERAAEAMIAIALGEIRTPVRTGSVILGHDYRSAGEGEHPCRHDCCLPHTHLLKVPPRARRARRRSPFKPDPVLFLRLAAAAGAERNAGRPRISRFAPVRAAGGSALCPDKTSPFDTKRHA